jgi:hypothetical protein
MPSDIIHFIKPATAVVGFMKWINPADCLKSGLPKLHFFIMTQSNILVKCFKAPNPHHHLHYIHYQTSSVFIQRFVISIFQHTHRCQELWKQICKIKQKGPNSFKANSGKEYTPMEITCNDSERWRNYRHRTRDLKHLHWQISKKSSTYYKRLNSPKPYNNKQLMDCPTIHYQKTIKNWKWTIPYQLLMNNICIMYIKCWFCGPDKGTFYTYAYIMYKYSIHVTEHYIRT